MELSFFKGFVDTLPESISLDALVVMMRTDESVRDYTEKHRYYRGMGNVSSAKYYKNRMPCFGVAARFVGGKRKEHITTLTGLTLVDIDHIAPDQMTTVLEKVHNDEHTLLAYTTLSGQGLRVLSKYAFNDNDNVNVNENSFICLSSVDNIINTMEQNLDTITHAQARVGHPEENTTLYTLHTTQESSHADFNENENENENCLRDVALNLTQNTQNSQNTHCFARVGHPEENTTLYTLHTTQESSHTESTEGKLLRPCCPPDGVSAMSESPLFGPTRKNVGCDDENFSSPKESRLRVLRGEASLYKTAFLQVNAYYAQLTGLDTDLQCKNVGRLSTIAHDEHLYYNPDAVPFMIREEEKKPVGRPRKGKSCRVEGVEATVLRELEQRGVVYAPGSHNKYISDACYMMNRYGVSEEECTAWALDRFADYQAEGNAVASIVHSCYQHTEEHGTARLPRTTIPYATIEQIRQYLTEQGIHIRHNVVTRKEEIRVENEKMTDERKHPEGDSKHYTLNSIQKKSHTDCTDYTEDASLSENISQRASQRAKSKFTCDFSASAASEDVNQQNLNEITQNLQVASPLLASGAHTHPEGASKHYTLNSKPRWNELEVKQVNSLHCRFCLDTRLRLHSNDLYIVIGSDLYPDYNPFADYLQRLPPWDGTTDHIGLLASRVHVAGGAQALHDRCLRKWLVAMLATWLHDDVVNHEILTYIGRQGIYKSSFMRELLPPELRRYFSTRNFAQRMDKDARFELSEVGLVCLEELDHMKTTEINQLKAIVTETHINERASYGRYKERRAHIASFCGTGNNPRFLSDPTGNRRWMPFVVDRIVSPYTHPFDYVGIYSQAYALLQQGFIYWFTEEDNAELDRHNQHFEEPSIEEELILTYLAQPYGDHVGEFLTATRIIELVGSSIRQSLSPRRIAFAMNHLGFAPRRIGNLRGWVAVILTGDQIKADQRSNAVNSQVEES